MSGRSRRDVLLQRVVVTYTAVMATLVLAVLCTVVAERIG